MLKVSKVRTHPANGCFRAGLLACGLMLLSGAALANVAGASIDANLYRASVPVADEQRVHWQQGVKEALLQVLVKVSGHPAVRDDKHVEASLSEAPMMVKAYRYTQRVDATDHEPAGHYLVVSFHPSAVDHLLEAAGQHVWSGQRPAVLVWLLQRGPQGVVQVVGRDQPPSKALRAAAKARGLGVHWPMLDLHEQASLDVQRLASFDATYVREVSNTYHADEVLVGVLQAHQADGVRVVWAWLTPHGDMTWRGEESGLEKAAVQGVVHVVDNLAVASQEKATAPPESVHNVRLAVTDVGRLGDYAALMRYVRQMPGVGSVQVEDVSKGGVVLNVALAGNPNALDQALQSGQRLQLNVAPPLEAMVDRVYRWSPGQANPPAAMV